MKLAAHLYKVVMNELLLRREAEGALDVHEEARYAGLLDDYWQMMSDLERDEVERLFAPTHQPKNDHDPSVVDRVVAKGAHEAPRRAA